MNWSDPGDIFAKRLEKAKKGTRERNVEGVCVLINSFKYFLEHVLIISWGAGFRLLVIDKWQLLADKSYKSPGAAKIAFVKMFAIRARGNSSLVSPVWSDFYNPGQNFLHIPTGEIRES